MKNAFFYVVLYMAIGNGAALADIWKLKKASVKYPLIESITVQSSNIDKATIKKALIAFDALDDFVAAVEDNNQQSIMQFPAIILITKKDNATRGGLTKKIILYDPKLETFRSICNVSIVQPFRRLFQKDNLLSDKNSITELTINAPISNHEFNKVNKLFDCFPDLKELVLLDLNITTLAEGSLSQVRDNMKIRIRSKNDLTIEQGVFSHLKKKVRYFIEHSLNISHDSKNNAISSVGGGNRTALNLYFYWLLTKSPTALLWAFRLPALIKAVKAASVSFAGLTLLHRIGQSGGSASKMPIIPFVVTSVLYGSSFLVELEILGQLTKKGYKNLVLNPLMKYKYKLPQDEQSTVTFIN